MSTPAKITLGASILFCCGSVWGVHYLQRYEKELLRMGLEKDTQRREEKEQQRINRLELESQKALHEALLKTQQVSLPPSSASLDTEA
ncbi:hypothetical protein BDF14DRAFT_1724075 [Spinellus fusiger]|nr:hypothetical protein BDF14DRAFT_1724075 [Spinellus fusiger]